MSAHKFTPGPWVEVGGRILSEGYVLTGAPIATVHARKKGGMKKSNARLIAAAPELLEALKELLTDMVIAQGNMQNAAKRDSMWEGCAQAIQPRVDAARAAIAKATGEAA